ncbi:alkaline phosphatase family protein [Gluconacetobacter sp.]|uniref:alkaline phosphatase family protein n=1 Tax=Gluconacetobacter sp. TaxID=1935994 RepID=UPI0039E72F1E
MSWIVPPAVLSEHPDAPPGYGEVLISRLMDIFVRHPDVWAKTAFLTRCRLLFAALGEEGSEQHSADGRGV